MSTTAAIRWTSIMAQKILDQLRIFFLGIGRLLLILFGLRSPSPHESATYLFLMLVFFVEAYVLFGLIIDRAAKDFSFFPHGFEKAAPVVVFLLVIVTLLLFCHQSLIFRNFP